MKLFQIEEPEGGPTDPEMLGAAIGIDVTGAEAQVAFSVGGNAVILADREGFERRLPVPPLTAANAPWQELFEAVRLRAERALARPVTHAVIATADSAFADKVCAVAEAAGLAVLRCAAKAELPASAAPAEAAAMLAEDLAPRPV